MGEKDRSSVPKKEKLIASLEQVIKKQKKFKQSQ